MKIAYFDCFSGISGDMLIGSLLDAGVEFEYLKNEINKLGLDQVEIEACKIVKQNIASTKFTVISGEQTHHINLSDLNALVDNTPVSTDIKEKAKEVFQKIAVAEAKIHNMPVEKVHFHEVGAVDTIVDVVGALICFKKLGIEKVFCSPLNVGSGFVTFSHGKFPVPAPATTEILKGVPVYSTDSKGELVTPTGAAVITSLADGFGDMPGMEIESTGYGAGSKDFEQPNVLRVNIGTSSDNRYDNQVVVIETNIDDMNPQWYDHLSEKLYAEGALEVFLTNIQMKKNRPGIKLTVMTYPEIKEKLMSIIFQDTTTIGVRVRYDSRVVLERESEVIGTKYGEISVKRAWYKGREVNRKAEYDDLKKLALQNGVSIKKVSEELEMIINKRYNNSF